MPDLNTTIEKAITYIRCPICQNKYEHIVGCLLDNTEKTTSLIAACVHCRFITLYKVDNNNCRVRQIHKGEKIPNSEIYQ